MFEMDKTTTYVRLLRCIRSSVPEHLLEFYREFPDYSLQERKALINLLRARHIPTSAYTTLYRVCEPVLRRLSRPLCRHFETLESLIQHADISALTLSLVLSAPYPHSTVTATFQDMVLKEMRAMESTPRTPAISWDDLTSLGNALHPDIKPSPYTNSTFRTMMYRWKISLQDSIIYPYCGHKSMSRSTLREFNTTTDNSFDSISPTQLEQFYSTSGVCIGGPCEMRQVWYPTLATPRTYYAMGGTAYFKARYVRDIFNVLADFFPATNRHTRVDPSHLNLDETDEISIYDLTSFTSLCHEQRNFLDFLATQTADWEITIFDTYHGMIRTSLGDLIREYNDLNKQPEYSLERVWPEELILKHSIAGFLGVYGNIVTCTIPHGLILSTISGKPNKQWCAGDDAGVAHNPNDRREVQPTSSTMGINNPEKTFSDREVDPAIALKRRFVRLPTFCTLAPNILFPPFSCFFEGDPRFRDDMYEHPLDRLHTFCSGLMSMLYQMSKQDWSGSDVHFLRSLLPELYRLYKLPVEGWFPPLCGQLGHSPGRAIDFSVPRILGSFWSDDPNRALLDAFMPEHFVGSHYEDIPWDGTVVDGWVSNSNKHLNLLTKLGYLTKEELRVTYTLPDEVHQAVYRQYLKDNAGRSMIVYSFSSLGQVPSLYDLW
jgi:hypothetical protein